MSLHPDEIAVDLPTVRALLQAQMPAFADQDLRAFASAGTDNWIFRLGEHAAVRLPRRPAASDKILKESRWLGLYADYLEIPCPKVLALGQPLEVFPWSWSLVSWLPGRPPEAPDYRSSSQAALDLAGVLKSLASIPYDPAAHGSMHSGEANNNRGVALGVLNETVEQAIFGLGALIDGGRVLKRWRHLCVVEPHSGAPVWLHADLHPGNLLSDQGRLVGVIDFGLAGCGDPACELIGAWADFDEQRREGLREALKPSPALWERGQGWAIYSAVITLDYYRGRHPDLEERAKASLRALFDTDVYRG